MRRKSQKASPQQSPLPRGIKHIRQPPNKFIVNVANTRYQVIGQICRELNYQLSYQRNSFEEDMMWRDTSISVDFLASMQQHQKVNHFPGMSNLSRKTQLTRNLKRMQSAFPESYGFFPLTFVLPQDMLALRKFQDRARFKGQRPTFIVKPEVGCQGKGIYLWQNNIELQSKSEVIQLYIQRPLLYKGLKFDFRVYTLITGCNPLRLYIFNEGLVLLATQTYQRPNEYNIEDLQMHLTNYSINKSNPKYIYNDSTQDLSKGHKKSMAQFFQMLKSLGLPAYQYWSTIKDIAVKTLIAGLPWLKKEYEIAQPLNKENTMCFEILSMDFLIQDNHKIHLLKISHTPQFDTETPLDYLVKSTLIKDTLELVKKQTELKNKLYGQSKKNSRVLHKEIIISTSDVTFSQKKQPLPGEDVQQFNYQLQQKDLGSFEKIYPSDNEQKQQKYNRLLSYSLSSITVEVSPKRKKTINHSNSRLRTLSESRNVAPQTNQFYYPSKQKVRLSTLLHPQRARGSHTRGLQRVFDREVFKQQINNRQQNQLQQRKRRGSYHIDEQYRVQTKSNAPQLQDILQKHQIIQGTPQTGERLVERRQSYT